MLKRKIPLKPLENQIGIFHNASILDVGCKSGKKLEKLKGKGLFRVGVDILKRFDSDINCVLADACMLPFKSASFDIVMSVEMMSHVWNVDLAIEEMKRVCSHIVFIKDTNLLNPKAILKLLLKLGLKWLWRKNRFNRISKFEDIHSVFWFKKKVGNSANVVCGRFFNNRVMAWIWKYFGSDGILQIRMS